jgi:hypothetical protein
MDISSDLKEYQERLERAAASARAGGGGKRMP